MNTTYDHGPATIGQGADRIRRRRHADTLFMQFTDDQIANGLAAMDALDPAQPLEPAPLGLLAFAPYPAVEDGLRRVKLGAMDSCMTHPDPAPSGR